MIFVRYFVILKLTKKIQYLLVNLLFQGHVVILMNLAILLNLSIQVNLVIYVDPETLMILVNLEILVIWVIW